MPLVKIKVNDIVYETNKAYLFLCDTREIWCPKTWVKRFVGKYAVVPQKFAEEKNLRFKTYYHTPLPLTPIYHQEPIDDLIYRPTTRL